MFIFRFFPNLIYPLISYKKLRGPPNMRSFVTLDQPTLLKSCLQRGRAFLLTSLLRSQSHDYLARGNNVRRQYVVFDRRQTYNDNLHRRSWWERLELLNIKNRERQSFVANAYLVIFFFFLLLRHFYSYKNGSNKNRLTKFFISHILYANN